MMLKSDFSGLKLDCFNGHSLGCNNFLLFVL